MFAKRGDLLGVAARDAINWSRATIKIATASQGDRLPDLIRCVGVSRSLSYDVFPPTQLCAPDAVYNSI